MDWLKGEPSLTDTVSFSREAATNLFVTKCTIRIDSIVKQMLHGQQKDEAIIILPERSNKIEQTVVHVSGSDGKRFATFSGVQQPTRK